MLFKAIQFAKLKHAGQTRKYTNEPYHNHPLRVAAIVSGLPTATEEQIAAAVLHDTLEYTQTTNRELEIELEIEFGINICNMVVNLTNVYTSKNYTKLNRTQRKEEENIRLAAIPYNCKEIKLADRLDNIRDFRFCPDGNFVKKYTQETFQLLKYLDMGQHPLSVEIEKLLYGFKNL